MIVAILILNALAFPVTCFFLSIPLFFPDEFSKEERANAYWILGPAFVLVLLNLLMLTTYLLGDI